MRRAVAETTCVALPAAGNGDCPWTWWSRLIGPCSSYLQLKATVLVASSSLCAGLAVEQHLMALHAQECVQWCLSTFHLLLQAQERDA